MSTVTLFLEVDGDADEVADLLERIRGIEAVSDVQERPEGVERGPSMELLQSITLTVTALGGTVASVNVILDLLKSTILKAKEVKRAWVDTPAGPEQIKDGE